MDPGELRHRVVIEKNTGGQDSYGATAESWVPIDGPRWAAIEPQTGKETFAADHTQAEVNVRVIMRYIKPLPTPDMRLRGVDGIYDGVLFDIVAAPSPEGRGRSLVLNCRHRV